MHADDHGGLAVRLRDMDALGVGEVDHWHPHLTHCLVWHSVRERGEGQEVRIVGEGICLLWEGR